MLFSHRITSSSCKHTLYRLPLPQSFADVQVKILHLPKLTCLVFKTHLKMQASHESHGLHGLYVSMKLSANNEDQTHEGDATMFICAEDTHLKCPNRKMPCKGSPRCPLYRTCLDTGSTALDGDSASLQTPLKIRNRVIASSNRSKRTHWKWSVPCLPQPP